MLEAEQAHKHHRLVQMFSSPGTHDARIQSTNFAAVLLGVLPGGPRLWLTRMRGNKSGSSRAYSLSGNGRDLPRSKTHA